MKKITQLLLLSLLMPLTLSAAMTSNVSTPGAARDAATRAKGSVPKAIKVDGNIHTLGMPKAEGDALIWDFEDAEQFAQFGNEDRDGDGFLWEYYNNSDVETDRMTAHSGDGLVASASYDNGHDVVLTPDNWLISPQLTLGGTLSFWACGQDPTYYSEKFGVFVSVDGENWTQIGNDKITTVNYLFYEYDLSAYAGQTGYFAIVHHNSTNMFYLNIDDIPFNVNGMITDEPLIPINLTADPTATTAQIAWVPGKFNNSWNLRWRPYVDPALIGSYWDPNVDNYDQISSQFMTLDADGDGHNWGLSYTDTYYYDICFYSESWDSNTMGALRPDNWLITPPIELGGSLKFKAWIASILYPDQFAVYIAPADWTSIDEFIKISDDIVPDSSPVDYEFDLSDYDGTGVIAFRHYGVTNLYRVMVDNIEVLYPDAPEVYEWTEAENVTSPYTIEGLTSNTEYEVQVMAFNEQGDKNSGWTESTVFTTLDDGGAAGYNEFYLVGSFNEWNQEDGGGRIELVEGDAGVYSASEVELAAGAEFKIITPAEDGGWIWFGGIDETQAGHFLVTPELLDNNIDLIDGANFRIQEKGIYTISVMEAPRGITAPLVMVVHKDATAISTIGTDSKVDNNWYNLQGQKLNGKPSAAGIYINNGRKVVIK